MTKVVEAAESDGGVRNAHGGGEPTEADELDILFRRWSRRARASAELDLHLEDAVRVDDLKRSWLPGIPHRALVTAMVQVHNQSQIDERCSPPEGTVPKLKFVSERVRGIKTRRLPRRGGMAGLRDLRRYKPYSSSRQANSPRSDSSQ